MPVICWEKPEKIEKSTKSKDDKPDGEKSTKTTDNKSDDKKSKDLDPKSEPEKVSDKKIKSESSMPSISDIEQQQKQPTLILKADDDDSKPQQQQQQQQLQVKDEPKQIKSDEPSIGHDDGDKRKPSKQLEQPEIIKRTALNEPEQLKKQEPISSDGRQIDPKSLNEFDEMAGKKPQSCIPQQTSRSSPESEPSVTQQSDTTTTTKPGVVVKDYKGNIVCEYMGKPGDIDVKPVKTIEKEDSTITRAFSPDKDGKDDLIKIQVKPFEEKITRAFSPEKQEKLSSEKTIEPTSKVLQPVDDKITRAFSSEKDDAEKDDWIEGLKSDILPSTDEDETSKKSPKKDDPSKERFSPTKSPIDDKIGKRDEPSDQPDDDDDEPVEEMTIDPKQPQKQANDIVAKTKKAKDPNKRLIIRFIIRRPDGESIEEMDIDPQTPDEDIDQIIRDLLQDMPSKIKDPKKDKIIFKIFKRRQHEPTEDESIGEFDIDPKNPERIADEIITKTIKPEKAQSKKDPKQKIVLRFVIVKPDGSQAIEDRIVDPSASDKQVDEIVREILRQAPKKLKDPKDKLKFKVLRRKPKIKNDQQMIGSKTTASDPLRKDKPETHQSELADLMKSADDEDEPVDEIDIDPKQPEKNVDEIIKKTTKSKEPNKRIKHPDEDIDQIIRELLRDAPTRVKDPENDKISFKILKRKQSAPTEDEQIGEFDIDPKNPERIANEIIKKAIKPEKAQSKKDPKQKIVLRFVIVKPDGSQAIEDRVMDPDTCDKDADEIIREILRQTPKKLRHPNDRSIFRVLRRKPIKDVSDATKPEPKSAESKILMKKDAKKAMENQKFPKQELEQEVEEEIEEEEGPTDDEPVEEFDIDQKSPMKNVAEIVGKTINAKEPGKRVVLRFIIRTPDEGDSIEEMEIDPETSDEDLDEIIRELLNDSPSKIQDPKKDRIIFKIMKRTPKDQEPTEDEQIAEFNIDPKSPEKIAKDIIPKAIQPLTLKPSKDTRERIVLRFIVRRPDGSESIEELVIDPRMTDNDIEGVIRDILRQTPGKLRDPRDKPILRVINRQPQQNKQQPKSQIDDEQQKITRPTSKPMSETQKPSKSRMNDEEEPVGDFEIDPQKPEKDIDQIIKKITSRARDPTKKLILRIIRQIPDRSDLVEEHLIQSETPESDIAKILGQLPKKVTDTREKTLINFVLKPRDNHRSPDDLPLTRDPNDNVIIRIVVQKPNNERSIEEFQLPTGSSKKDIENLIRQVNQSTTPKIKEPNTQIITRVVKQTPDGQESIKEYHVDQRTAPTDIDEIIRKNIRPKQRRIITRVVIRKPDGTETVEEIEIDPDEENIDEVIRRKLGETASKITGPAKISTRLIRQKPDGSEEEEEDLDLYPKDDESDDDNYDNDEQLEEFEIDPKSPEKIIDSIVNRMLRSKVPDRRLVIRYVIIRPEEGELIEEMIVDPRTTDGEIREIIHEILMETPSKIKDPRDRVVFRIIHRPSKHEQQQQTAEDQDETIGEFEINPKFPETNADEIIHRATTSQQRQPKEQIIIRFIIIRPGFGEQIEELEIDPQLDDDNIGHIIRDMLRQAPAKLRDPQDRIVFAIVKRKRKQKQQKTRDIDDMIRQAIRSSVPKPSCRLSTTGAEETIGEIEIIPETSQQAIGDFVRRTIHSPNSRIGDSNNVRIIIRILSRKSTIGDVDDLIEQFEMSPASGEKDIDAVVRKILRTITTRSPEPNERIILRIIKRRQGSQDSLDDEPESATGDDIDEIIRRSLKTQTSTIRDPSGKIITRVVRLKPGGEEPVKEVEMDPKCTEGDIDEIIREAIQTSRNKYPSGKMITRIIRMKSGGEESIEELAMDPETPQVDLDDMIRKAVRTTISRIKDSNSKMITRIVRLKPGGSESIEELEVDPELQEEENGDNNDIREKNCQHLPYTKIITRIVRQNADDREEILEEFETIPESADSDIDDAIRESILSATSLIQDPNTKIITRVIRLKPCGEKSIEEFEMDPECSDIDSDIDDAIRKAIRTRSLTIKDSTGKIITRVVRKKSDGQESIEDLDDEQQQSAKTYEQPEGIGQYVRKTIRDTISPVKDKAGDLISRAFKQQQHQMTTTTLTTTQTAGIKHRPATKTTTNESFGFMRKTYSSAVKEQPRDMKGKSPPFRAGLPTRDIHDQHLNKSSDSKGFIKVDEQQQHGTRIPVFTSPGGGGVLKDSTSLSPKAIQQEIGNDFDSSNPKTRRRNNRTTTTTTTNKQQKK
ncbi:Neuroblast differentiation-associated protein, variant 4 [Dermatophagoides farinae]|uniref:Neuroblast differentiation-associated protein, variant 4 n=1 Tax=Dermatophagoides farinae TaxID=6954 RepID=A0A922IFD5_DERFA|nr:Neuroblast differentiation-associated protein, variant 4 [Dermatophagoides farinae]